MCGITGMFAPQGNPDKTVIDAFIAANDMISYRGPDGSGFWARGTNAPYFLAKAQPAVNSGAADFFSHRSPTDNGDVFFGHRRLSIIDLSDAAAQPFSFGPYTLVFNGEIYNYIELREELEGEGIKFSTKSDTEVLIKAYDKWGTEAFNRFNGMWALAIWDENKKELVLSRDRMGVKPLHYAIIDNKLFFGSEIKQLLFLQKTLTGEDFLWNPPILNDFLNKSLIHHTEETLYQGVYTFPQSHFAKLSLDKPVTLEEVRKATKRYWDFPSEAEELTLSLPEVISKFKELLESAVKLRLRSDVPVGSALSGGLDSSAIVSLITRLDPTLQKTFTAIFPGEKFDERFFAEAVIAGKNIEGVFVQPRQEQLKADLKKLIYHQDGPVTSTSMFAQWEVFKAAKENKITVMLDGQGADEILGGYEGFFKNYFRSVSKKGLLHISKEIIPFLYKNRNYFLKRLRDKFKLKETTGIKNRVNSQYFSPKKYKNPLRQALYEAVSFSSLPALLHYEDRNSMAFSIESRTPFLDYRLVEFAFKVPPEFLIHRGIRKYILREAMKGVIPESVRLRSEKLGFVAPEFSLNQSLGDLLKNTKDKGLIEFSGLDLKCVPGWKASLALLNRQYLNL